MFNPLHRSTNPELFKKNLCNQGTVANMKNMGGAMHPSYHLKVKYPLRFFASDRNLFTYYCTHTHAHITNCLTKLFHACTIYYCILHSAHSR